MKARGLEGNAVEMHFYAALCTLLNGDFEGFRAALTWLRDPTLARGCASRYPHVHALQGIERLLDKDEAAVRQAFSTALQAGRVQWAFHTHLLYGVALHVMGGRQEGSEHLNRAQELARAYRWDLPLAALPELERRLIDVLGRRVEFRGEDMGTGSVAPAH